MDSQIEQLPDLAGYLKFASVPNWQRVALAAPNDSGDARAGAQARSVWQRWRANNAGAPKSSSRGRSTEPPHHTSSVSRDGTDYDY
jgi:hypothetical protein